MEKPRQKENDKETIFNMKCISIHEIAFIQCFYALIIYKLFGKQFNKMILYLISEKQPKQIYKHDI